MMDLTIIMLKALIGAFLWSVVGIASKQDEEAFDPAKLVSTFFAATVIAFMEVVYGVDPGTGEVFYTYLFLKTGITGLVDKILKVIWRRWLRAVWLGFTKEEA